MRSIETLFRPKKQETRADSTDLAFRKIIEADGAARRLKNERLKSARLAKDAAERLDKLAPSGRKPPQKKVR